MSGMLLHIKQIKINIIVFKPRLITNYGKFRDRYAVAYVWVQVPLNITNAASGFEVFRKEIMDYSYS